MPPDGDSQKAQSVRGMLYEDLARPTLSRVGELLGRTVGVALGRWALRLHEREQIFRRLEVDVTSRLEQRGVTEEQIIPPPPSIQSGVVLGVLTADDAPELWELYANLLATSMDATTADNVHPSFAEIIRQLTPDEARMLQYLGARLSIEGYVLAALARGETVREPDPQDRSKPRMDPLVASLERPRRVPVYVDNLERLGLCERQERTQLRFGYPKERDSSRFAPFRLAADRRRLVLTAFGRLFLAAVGPERPRPPG